MSEMIIDKCFFTLHNEADSLERRMIEDQLGFPLSDNKYLDFHLFGPLTSKYTSLHKNTYQKLASVGVANVH